jgi:hypothetical protein
MRIRGAPDNDRETRSASSIYQDRCARVGKVCALACALVLVVIWLGGANEKEGGRISFQRIYGRDLTSTSLIPSTSSPHSSETNTAKMATEQSRLSLNNLQSSPH